MFRSDQLNLAKLIFLATCTYMYNTCTSCRSSQGNTPYGTPPGSTHSDSVDLNTVSASNLLAVGGKDSRPPSPDTGAKAHSRNLSDSGLLQSEGTSDQ